jgi:hypothetical protein
LPGFTGNLWSVIDASAENTANIWPVANATILITTKEPGITGTYEKYPQRYPRQQWILMSSLKSDHCPAHTPSCPTSTAHQHIDRMSASLLARPYPHAQARNRHSFPRPLPLSFLFYQSSPDASVLQPAFLNEKDFIGKRK